MVRTQAGDVVGINASRAAKVRIIVASTELPHVRSPAQKVFRYIVACGLLPFAVSQDCRGDSSRGNRHNSKFPFKCVNALYFQWSNAGGIGPYGRPGWYRAFRLAGGQILEALEPGGEIKSPNMREDPDDPESPFIRTWIESFKSPEARGEFVANHILSAFAAIPQWTAEQREQQWQSLKAEMAPQTVLSEFYGMPDAARDLRIEQRSGETIPITLPLMPFYWSLNPPDKGDKK